MLDFYNIARGCMRLTSRTFSLLLVLLVGLVFSLATDAKSLPDEQDHPQKHTRKHAKLLPKDQERPHKYRRANAKLLPINQDRLNQFFPGVSLSEPEGPYQVQTLTKDGQIQGYLFQTISITRMPAYSGKPVNLQILLDNQGNIVDAYMLKHEEPILLVGISEQALHDFDAKYAGLKPGQRVVVGRSSDPNVVTVDAIAGATVTVIVINEVIMRAVNRVATSLGLIEEKKTRCKSTS